MCNVTTIIDDVFNTIAYKIFTYFKANETNVYY